MCLCKRRCNSQHCVKKRTEKLQKFSIVRLNTGRHCNAERTLFDQRLKAQRQDIAAMRKEKHFLPNQNYICGICQVSWLHRVSLAASKHSVSLQHRNRHFGPSRRVHQVNRKPDWSDFHEVWAAEHKGLEAVWSFQRLCNWVILVRIHFRPLTLVEGPLGLGAPRLAQVAGIVRIERLVRVTRSGDDAVILWLKKQEIFGHFHTERRAQNLHAPTEEGSFLKIFSCEFPYGQWG